MSEAQTLENHLAKEAQWLTKASGFEELSNQLGLRNYPFHSQITIQDLNGEDVEVDVLLAELLQKIWRHGRNTIASCQGGNLVPPCNCGCNTEEDGLHTFWANIHFSNEDDARWFHGIVEEVVREVMTCMEHEEDCACDGNWFNKTVREMEKNKHYVVDFSPDLIQFVSNFMTFGDEVI